MTSTRPSPEPAAAPAAPAVPPAWTAEQRRYLDVQEAPEFQALRRRYRRWVLPVAAGALAWYFLYVLLAAWATSFMAQPLIGSINVGLVLGLLQFASTFGVTALYVRFADRVLDPASERIRDGFERSAR